LVGRDTATNKPLDSAAFFSVLGENMKLFKFLSLALFIVTGAIAGKKKSLPQRDICPLHHVQMKNISLPIHFGLPKLDLNYEKAKEKLFPKANEECVIGGCMVGPESPKEETVFVCDQCTSARTKWLDTYRK
jgi:hypothetical protein